MRLLKTFARKIVFPTITTLSLEKLLSLFSNQRLIIVYHGVLPSPDLNLTGGHLPTAEFEKQLKYFKKNLDVIPLQNMFEIYRAGGNIKRKTISITFDDGYENNFTQAFPLLKKYQLPATFFITSGCYIKNDFFLWYDLLDFIKKDISFDALDLTKLHVRSHLKNALISKYSNTSELKNLLKKLNPEEKNEVFNIIKTKQPELFEYKNRIPDGYWKMISKEQLKEMADSELVEIGSHTVNHPNLSEINIEEVEYEVSASKRILEDITQKKIVSIAFPDGDYNDKVKEICLKAGFNNLLSVDYRSTSDPGDKSILPRYCISNTTISDSNIIMIHSHFLKTGF